MRLWGCKAPWAGFSVFRRRCKLARPIPIATPLSHATTASHPPWAPAAPRPPHTAFKYKELLLDYVAFACPFGAPMQIKIICAMPLFLQPGISGYEHTGSWAFRKGAKLLLLLLRPLRTNHSKCSQGTGRCTRGSAHRQRCPGSDSAKATLSGTKRFSRRPRCFHSRAEPWAVRRLH